MGVSKRVKLVKEKRGQGIGRKDLLYEGGNATECFYSTLNLKCLGRFDNGHNNFYQVRVKGQELLQMGHKAAESPAHVGNKVLPI
ncbi:hypothetical protein Syun_006516 [Stephania yunnanensis]|uniref:Uncharacterized protein n=1 Tax=Stephania yunnanensis TaxID=152371 RepID=A0AAP0KXR1_9MAGN